MTRQHKDDGGAIIALLGLRYGGGKQVVFNPSTSTLSSALHASSKIITITATNSCFIEIGTSSASASTSTSHYLLGGVPYDISIGDTSTYTGSRYIAVIGASTTGTLYISERE